MVIIFEIELPANQSATEIIQFASLRVDFYAGKNSAYSSLTAFDEEQEELLQRLAGLPCLERFDIPEYWYRCELHCAESELDRLRRLNRVQDIYFSPTSIDELKDADVEWMLEHWHRLSTIRMPDVDAELKFRFDSVKVLKDRGVACLSVQDLKCP